MTRFLHLFVAAISVPLCVGCGTDNDRQALQKIASDCGVPDLKIEPDRHDGKIVLNETFFSTPDIKELPPRQAAIFSCTVPRAIQAGIELNYSLVLGD